METPTPIPEFVAAIESPDIDASVAAILDAERPADLPAIEPTVFPHLEVCIASRPDPILEVAGLVPDHDALAHSCRQFLDAFPSMNHVVPRRRLQREPLRGFTDFETRLAVFYRDAVDKRAWRTVPSIFRGFERAGLGAAEIVDWLTRSEALRDERPAVGTALETFYTRRAEESVPALVELLDRGLRTLAESASASATGDFSEDPLDTDAALERLGRRVRDHLEYVLAHPYSWNLRAVVAATAEPKAGAAVGGRPCKLLVWDAWQAFHGLLMVGAVRRDDSRRSSEPT